jgi:hypothetical protein
MSIIATILAVATVNDDDDDALTGLLCFALSMSVP